MNSFYPLKSFNVFNVELSDEIADLLSINLSSGDVGIREDPYLAPGTDISTTIL
jgi:hypothetical protein